MFFTVLAALTALAVIAAGQVLLVVMAADRLPAEAITGREPREAVLPTTDRRGDAARDVEFEAGGRYVQTA